MESVVLILIIAIGITSYQGLKNASYFNKYLFRVDDILIHKEYYRILSSGFLHVNWLHLAFNVLALHSFGAFLMEITDIGTFILIYLVSLIGGSLLALYIHRNHGDYSAAGASGAISGVVFACILLDPFGHITFLGIEELEIISWLFGILYVIVSIYGIKTSWGNIGHEAHLGGAISGLVLMASIQPSLLSEHGWVFFLLFIPTALFLLLISKHPQFLLIDGFKSLINLKSLWSKPKVRMAHKNEEKLWEYNQKKKKKSTVPQSQQTKIDKILDKISESGYPSLTDDEKSFLFRYSKED